MTYAVRYAKQAIRDLDRVFAEVAEASGDEETARRYADGLIDKIEGKAAFPKSGAPLYYGELFTGFYFVVFKAYLTFYRVEGSEMLVDRVLYRKSDYLRAIFRPDAALTDDLGNDD